MINLFHGQDTVSSRKALPQGAKRFDAKQLTPESLAQVLNSRELYGASQPLVIEGLINSPLLKQVLGSDMDIYLWEGKKLTVTQLKKLPQVKTKEFKIPAVLWQFLNSLKLADLELCLKTEPVELVWYLLHRQASRRQQVELLKKMYLVELDLKSGKSDVPLRTQLELLL
ncbi:MAG: hypothetical protein U1C50_01225 [Patescibacteria group bacterium]|nr:hypothetical protein [Candidatus Beckwithbacteria bacterium]MDZ4228858.1 hypothetical protein [Patescibacteria group bacterium]